MKDPAVKNHSSVRAARAARLAALGEPTRLAIMDLLAETDRSPDGLARDLGISAPLLAHHVTVLEEAGLIQRTPSQHDRRRIYLQAVPAAMHALLPTPPSCPATRVLFICTQNSARSVLAAALWQATSEVPCASAGTRPAADIHPRARRIARRLGLSLDATAPQGLEDVVHADDLVVSVCDEVNEELPMTVNRRLHWSIPDPVLLDTDAAFRDTVARLAIRVSALAAQVVQR